DGKYALGGLVPGTWTLTPTKADWSFTPALRQVEISETDPTGQDFTGSTSSPVIEEWAEAACTAESTAQGTGWRVIPGGGEAGPATAGLLTTGWRLRAGASGAAALAAVEGSLRRDRWSASGAGATPGAGASGQRLRLAGAALAAQAEVTARATATLFARAVAECWAVVEALGGQLTYGSGTVQGVTEVEATGERGREGSAQAETQSSATGTGMRLRFAQAGGNMQAAATGTGQAAFSAQAALALHAVVSVAAAALHGVRAVTASMIMWASGRLAPSRLTASGRLAPCRWLAREIGGNGMDYLGIKEKMPEEIVPRRWSVDFGPNLVPGETITGASLRVRDRETLEDVTATMVHGGPVVEDSRVSAIFAGGATGHEYAVTVEVHTSAGAVNQEVFLIAVRTPPGV
ncbi:MAG: hypothetical protein GX100_13430, partial [candidate division WS1 bacterium]|nr:hypothetical protein [candidate division WS1 bacterium]